MYKLIIAEDEKLTRDGIVKLINSSGDMDFEISGEAEDGEQALALTREKKPDVIITDINMPKLNGLEFIECVRDECPDIMIIIISGYDDYHYMQKAMQLGVKDYLMKPVLPDQIREILTKVKEDMERRQKFLHNIEELKKQVIESLPIVRERFFNELINGKLSKEDIDKKADYLKLDLKGKLYAAAILKIKNYIEVEDPAVRKEELIQYFLFDIISEIFSSHFKVYAFAKTDYQIILLICVKDLPKNSAFIQINHSIAKLVSSLQRYLGVTVFAAISRLYNDYYSFSSSYEEADLAMTYNFSAKSSSVVNYEDISITNKSSRKRPVELEEKVVLHSRLCERNRCEELIQDLFSFFVSCSENSNNIKMDIFELIMMVFRNSDIREDSDEFLNISQFSAYEQILRCDTISELEQWTSNFFQKYIDAVEKARISRSVTVIEKVKELCCLCMGEEKFSLDDVASKLFISPNYLRQIFKQKTGESFVEYLTRIRMEKAAELLSDPVMKVQQIAEKVGYENQQYFAMCFKKHFRCTPSDYRRINNSTFPL